MKVLYITLFFALNLCSTSITRGPYFNYLDKENATIRYLLDKADISWFAWGENPYCDKYLTPMIPKENNYINLYGLKPQKDYCYKIYLNIDNSTYVYVASSSTFKTFYDDTVSSFSFIIMGNTGYNSFDENLTISSSIFIFLDVMFFINTGNISQDGTITSIDDNFFKPFSNIIKSYPIYLTLGPIEYGNSAEKDEYNFLKENYTKYFYSINGFFPHYYFFDVANARFIFLDNNSLNGIKSAPSLKVGTKQYKWLEDLLKSSKNKKWIFVVLNSPLYPYVVEDNETRNNLEELLLKYNVNFVIQNGYDNYLRTKPIKYGVYDENGIMYLVVGGSNFYNNEKDSEVTDTYFNEKGFVYFKIHETYAEIIYYNLSLESLDKFVVSAPI